MLIDDSIYEYEYDISMCGVTVQKKIIVFTMEIQLFAELLKKIRSQHLCFMCTIEYVYGLFALS